MIVELLFSPVFTLLRSLVGLLPSVSFALPDGLFDAVHSIFYGVGWCLPVAALSPILVVEVALIGFKLVLAIVVRIKSFIPTLGGT